ncbi:hypothetical protein J422_02689 [Methanocaldococcus villosus KIN24-T80]|uniref:Uncharacterized protein n=1 Tax=Methanocaldococcus villosus KIN24-T80 TaxID=1069083 RepID=N6VYZ8_9EURY|nr:hypothetical protein [Methanocaldococcus villosus]ENN96352.1 hypothetical protein J422_02689 [Methanocaldococcus villosus KIN24-T80]
MLKYIIFFQNFVKKGSLKILLTNIFLLEINKDEIILNLENPKTFKEIFIIVERIIKTIKNDKKEDSFLKKIENFKNLLDSLKKLSNILINEKKTFILRYKNEDVIVIGYKAKGGLLLKDIKINKLLLLKLLKELNI